MSDLEPSDGTPSPSLYAPLPRPPTALSLTVRKLLGKVREGAIRVPSFQRPLRWDSDDVLKLFDSLLRGYPVGSLLFWKQSFKPATVQIGVASFEAPAVADGWYIVDGQQRTTALAASLLGLDQQGDRRWNLYFDPTTNAIERGPVPSSAQRRLVPVHVLGDLQRLGRWLRDCELTEVEQARVEEVQQRLLDYELPAYLMETDDIDALRGVFARLNSTGVRMRADEVFQALLGTTSAPHGARRRLDLDQLQTTTDIDGFGVLPRSELLKSVLAMSGLDPTRRLDDLGDDALAQLVDLDDAAEALRRTVGFLQAATTAAEPGAQIPAYTFLPYPVVFVILARWFHLFPSSDEVVRRSLAQWLWRGVATGVHQRAAVSAMRLQVRHIRDGEMIESLRRLLDTVGEPAHREWSLDPFHKIHAASRVEILAMLAREPRDKRGLVSWRSLVSNGERVAREIFRVDQFERGPLRTVACTAANRVLLDARHTDLRVELKKWSWQEDRALLESHLIDEANLRDLQSNEPEAFLTRRAARIRASVSTFLASRAGIDGPRVLPASAYFDLDRRAVGE